jgi:SNF2 family DNA or RNA helicase
VYPIESPEPQGLLETVKLRPYQKQSLAFMLDLEEQGGAVSKKKASVDGITSRRISGQPVRGGMLCDEMGMGKTMCCISLVLAHPFEPTAGDSRKKTTVIIAQNTLVQQ